MKWAGGEVEEYKEDKIGRREERKLKGRRLRKKQKEHKEPVKMDVFWVVTPYSLVEFTDVSEMLAVSIIRAHRPETSVNFCQTTRRNNSEDSHLHTRRRENLK
jgi:hypothetical protein